MKLFYPDIFESFRCIGGACEDNCCKIGWDIEIDEGTAAFYVSQDSELGRQVSGNLTEEDGCLYLKHEGGCPFLNSEGLCSLQLSFGEEHISDICREHPRFYEWFGDYKEAGIGLACEEAARLLISREKPILFTEKTIDEEPDDLEFDPKLLEGVKKIRQRLIEILQDRGFSLLQRLGILLYSTEDIQNAVFDENVQRLTQLSGMLAIDGLRLEIVNEAADAYYTHEKEACTRLLRIMGQMDYMGGELKSLFEMDGALLDKIIENELRFDRQYEEFSYELENLAVYFVYRYLIKAVRDYAVTERLFAAVFCTLAVRLLFMREYAQNGALPDKGRRAYLIKEFSKEIEYDMDNMDIIYGEIQSGGINFDMLCGLAFNEA